MFETLKIGLIQGSIRRGRFNDVLARWTRRGLAARGFRVHVVDPAEPGLLPLQTGHAEAEAALAARLAPLDGFVVVTPEMNHAAPGPLKTLIDAAGREWEAKPVGFVCYGGVSGGLRAVEALRLVFAELHAPTLRDTVSFANPWRRFDEAARLKDPGEAEAAERAMAVMADRLEWWARALRAARKQAPYRRAA